MTVFSYEILSRAVIEGDAEETIKLTKLALAHMYPVENILEQGLMVGMQQMADKFKETKVLVPEVLLATRAMNAGLFILEPYFRPKHKESSNVLLGTVTGDLHDIGKNLVRLLIMTTGVRVIDLGVDVSVKEFVTSVRKLRPQLLLMASLLTTTMPMMREVIETLAREKLREVVKIGVGGTPVSRAFATEIGADYYFSDAFEVKKFLEDNSHKLMIK